MLRNVINKFKTFAMLSAFVILFSSCDNSTSVNEGNSALKKDIAEGWTIYRTLVEQNHIKEYTGDYHDIGYSDTLNLTIAKLQTTDNVITLKFGNYDIVGEWMSSETYNFPHWVCKYKRFDIGTWLDYQTIIEITGINPLKGIWVDKMSDSTFTGLKTLRKFEFTGNFRMYVKLSSFQ